MSPKSILLIILQFSLLGYIFITGILTPLPYLLSIQLLGIAIAFWGVISIGLGNFNIQPEVRSEKLISRGPFKYIRNPMYTGILCICIPAVFFYQHPLRWAALGILIIVLLLKIKHEENYLSMRFSEEYSLYMEKTKRLIPYLF